MKIQHPAITITIGFLATFCFILILVSVWIVKVRDNAKVSSDAAVRNLEDIRKEYAELFYILDAYDEESRTRIIRETLRFFIETAAPSDLGLRVVEAYARNFHPLIAKRLLSDVQYTQGIKQMLSFANLHGRIRTPDLIILMAGWSMTDPNEQAVYCRQLTAAANYSGLKPDEMIRILTESLPSINLLKWSPVAAIEAIGTIASNKSDQRSKVAAPIEAIWALAHPFQRKDSTSP